MTFTTLQRRPALAQWLVNDFIVIVLTATGFVVAGMEEQPTDTLLFWLSTFIAACLLYHLIYMRRMRYYITGEQLIYEHGVFHVTRDYIELYRVVDYREESTFLQQLLNLKTVRVISGDKTTPRVDLVGMRRNDDLIGTLRRLVAYNRKRSLVYEITNR